MSVLTQVADRLSGGRLTHREFESRLNEFLADGKAREGDGQILNSAFARSGGRWLTEASQELRQKYPSYEFSDAHDDLGLWKVPGSLETTLATLNAQGYAILETKLSPERVKELSDAFAGAPCTLTSDKPTGLQPGETVAVDFENPLAEKYAVETGSLIANATVRNMLLDKGLLEIAQRYIGSAPMVDIVTAWFSFPSDAPSHQAAQLFHFDLDRIKWLKVFFLLTDQTIETGAHLYVPGTHRDGGIDEKILSKGYVRLSDDEVAARYPKDTWVSMEAPAGTILLEDTRGLHKGISVQRDHRLMLQFEYTQCLFGEVPFLATVDLPDVQDDYWNRMKATYPLVFEALTR